MRDDVRRGGVRAWVKILSRSCAVTSDGGSCGRRDLSGGIAILLPHPSGTDPAISAFPRETLDLMLGRWWRLGVVFPLEGYDSELGIDKQDQWLAVVMASRLLWQR